MNRETQPLLSNNSQEAQQQPFGQGDIEARVQNEDDHLSRVAAAEQRTSPPGTAAGIAGSARAPMWKFQIQTVNSLLLIFFISHFIGIVKYLNGAFLLHVAGMAGFVIVTFNAIMLKQLAASGDSEQIEKANLRHGHLQSFSLICMAIGFIPPLLHPGKHFQSAHSILGLITVVLVVVASGFGIAARRQQSLFTTMTHSVLGKLILVLTCVCITLIHAYWLLYLPLPDVVAVCLPLMVLWCLGLVIFEWWKEFRQS